MVQGKVLVVEDEPEVAEVLEYNLARQGFQTLSAADGLTACRLIGTEQPDLILLDLMLPDLDGREICRLIRGHKDQRLATTPILMLTALAEASNRVGGLSLGADDYVTKPFSVEEVVLRASRMVARRRAEEETATRAAKQEERETLLLNLQDILFHELKNQLLIVAGYSSRLHERGALLPAEKVRSYARAIHSSSRYLFTMAEDMLLLRRIESGEVEMPDAWTPTEELIASVTDLVRPQAGERGATIHVELSRQVTRLRVNAPAAKIVLSCLLENAVKYGRQGGRVDVGGEAVSGERVTIWVEDDGAGIPEGEIDRVFDKFYRGTNARHATKGTGLGLYFAKTLTGALRGSIRVQSTVGRGSRFEVELPARAG